MIRMSEDIRDTLRALSRWSKATGKCASTIEAMCAYFQDGREIRIAELKYIDSIINEHDIDIDQWRDSGKRPIPEVAKKNQEADAQ